MNFEEFDEIKYSYGVFGCESESVGDSRARGATAAGGDAGVVGAGVAVAGGGVFIAGL